MPVPLAPALAVAGSAISAVGAVSGGLSQAAQANYEAQVAKNNAQVANQNANYALAAGQTQATDVGLRERAKQGTITAGIAANNLDVNTGSARQVRESAAELGGENVQRTLTNAQLIAYGYRTNATTFQAESQLEKAAAPRDILGGVLSGLGTLSTGAANVLGPKWSGLANPLAIPNNAIAGGP